MFTDPSSIPLTTARRGSSSQAKVRAMFWYFDS